MYAEETDLAGRFGVNEISNLKSMQTDSYAVDNALQDATEEIDSYIGVRYQLPLPNVPNNLKRIACDIARYRLYYQQPTEEVRQRYTDAIDFLKRVADGKATLAILDETSQEIIDDAPKAKPMTKPIGTTYTGGVFGDATLDKMPSIGGNDGFCGKD